MFKLILLILFLAIPTLGADIAVHSADNLQTKINSANCGDRLLLDAGSSWSGSFTLPNTCPAGTAITITTSNYTSLPSTAFVTSANYPNMATIKSLGGGNFGEVFTTATNSAWWILDGLILTDNAGSNMVTALLDFGVTNQRPHDLVVKRCAFVQKETGTTYTRSIQRGIWFEGDRLSATQNNFFLIGIPYGGSTEPLNTESLLCISCNGLITFEHNYVGVWYNGIFLGGGDTAPLHTATLTGSSTTSATFSNVTNLGVNDVIRLGITGTGTISSGGTTLTRITGAVLDDGDGNLNNNWGPTVKVVSTIDGSNGLGRLNVINGNTYTLAIASSALGTITAGACTWELYQTAQVTNIAGSVITYNPYGVNAVRHAPQNSAWNHGDEGLINDVTIRFNTFEVPIAFATYLQGIGRGCPKGAFELKNVNRFDFEGNIITGYPATLAITADNQNGTAPWIKADNIIIKNNKIAPTTGFPDCARSAMIISDDGYLNTITRTESVEISNNLILHVRSMLEQKYGNSWLIKHNTILNNEASNIKTADLVFNQGGAIPAMNFRDNIGRYNCYGMNGGPLGTLWPGGVFLKNVIVDDLVGCSGGINTSQWGANSILNPVAAVESSIKFIDAVNGNYRLASDSPYKNLASDGTDPGINQDVLEAAIGGQTCNWNTSPACH